MQLWNLHYVKDIKKIERIQKRATKLIHSCSKLSYDERLKKLDIISLEERRYRADLLYMYKIIHNYVDIDYSKYISFDNNKTRGHNFKIKKRRFNTDIGKYSFFNRIINPWNTLPAFVVNSKNIKDFKNNINTFRKDI